MKLDKNDAAYPTVTGIEYGCPIIEGGLTIRAELAARAMQGLLSSLGTHDVIAPDEIASDAVNYADALLAELNREVGL